MNILVTGAGGESAIATIRILKKTTNHKIFAADCNISSIGFYLADEWQIIPKATD